MTTWQNTQSLFGRLALALFIVFALYSNVRLIIRNQKLTQRLKQVNEDNNQKELGNKKLGLLIYYYGSSAYQDVAARQKLNMKKPDETMIAFKGLSADDTRSTLDSIYNNISPTAPPPQSNFSRWWQYFFGQN